MSASTVLVVDDNPTNLKLVADLLGFEGHRVLTATDAASTLAILRKEVPNLILMDIGLPEVDGLALTRMIKSNPETAPIKIVALTAFAMKADEARAREAGCDGYITKPIDTRRLPELVASYISSDPTQNAGED